MFDIGGWELLVIGALALIIVGPKDLPRMIRSVGQWVAKARGLAREFQSGMEDAARQADIDELRKSARVDVGLDDAMADVRSIGEDTKRALNTPPKTVTTNTPPTSAPKPAAVSDAASKSFSNPSSKPASSKPTASTPPLSNGRGAVSGGPLAPQDDEQFLESFERNVRGEESGADASGAQTKS